MVGITIDSPQTFGQFFSVSRETLHRLELYGTLLQSWQKAVQLVAPSTLETLWSRHFGDSAQLLSVCPSLVKTWIDIGSGAGFPGLVVAILANDPLSQIRIERFILVESDTRKAAFLKEVTRRVGVTVDILSDRIESPSTQVKVGYGDVFSARACAPLIDLLGYVYPYWKSSSEGLFLKGGGVNQELVRASEIWDFKVELKPSLSDLRGRVLRIWDLKPKRGG